MPEFRNIGQYYDQAWSSAAVSNNAAIATIPAVVGKTAYITGIDVSGGGATSALAVDATVLNLQSGNTIHLEIAVAPGVTAPMLASNLFYSWRPLFPLAANATNTAIGVTVPAFGAGNTNAAVIVYGYYS